MVYILFIAVSESLGIKQILLKGARLKNTEYIYGISVYTGRLEKYIIVYINIGYIAMIIVFGFTIVFFIGPNLLQLFLVMRRLEHIYFPLYLIYFNLDPVNSILLSPRIAYIYLKNIISIALGFFYLLCFLCFLRDTKTALNQPKAKYKFSTVERRLNYFLAFYFVFLIFICTLSVLYHESWNYRERRFWPLFMSKTDEYVKHACYRSSTNN